MKRYKCVVIVLAFLILCAAAMAATISHDWPASATQIEGVADGYTTLSGTTEEFSSVVTMDTGGEMVAIAYVEINYDATPTDNVVIKVYRGRDNTAGTRDTRPCVMIYGDNSVDPERISVPIPAANNWWISVTQDGSTDSHDVRTYWEGVEGTSV